MNLPTTRLPDIIDVHCHIVPEQLPANPIQQSIATWPSMRPGGCGLKTFHIGDHPFRDLDSSAWDVNRRLDDMAQTGIGMQVLSPMPELLSYWLDETQTATLADYTNATIASMVASNPMKFCGLAMVTLQNPDRAAREVSELRSRFGLVGVEVGSHVNGLPIGDRRFDVFFDALIASKLCLFVHALHPQRERILGPSIMEALVGFPCETGYSAVSFIATGVLDRHPGLRVVFSHGGGALGLLLPRLEQGWRVSNELQDKIAISPTEQAKRFYYDALVFSSTALHYLIDSFGQTQIMIGTDYPFLLREKAPVESLLRTGRNPDCLAGIAQKNARKFLCL